MKTALTDRLGLELPIIQAPMAGTSTPELAAAVSNAGALGSTSIAAVDAVEGQRQIQTLKALTMRPININVFCHAPTPPDLARDRVWIDSLRPIFAGFDASPPETLNEIYQSFLTDDAKLAVLLEERPAVVSFHFGLPQPEKIAALKVAGCILLASATTPEEARLAQIAGIDMVVAQGVEAGGHRGVFDPADDPRFATLPLTRLLTRELDIPVVAAGGIMDGAGIAAALALGAAGAQLGTAFVSCPESAANPAYRAALAGPRAERTRVSAVISGRPARGVENAFMRRADATLTAGYPYAYDLGKALNAVASAQGDDGYAPQWAGQAAPLTRGLPATELVEALAQETRSAIHDLQRLL
ncbi:NAD(P)H-dependent flavin oxidoreductase [Brevundimonas sp.]|uniref:NAD(P)H-dependent flavin oxidoreductase n=1 Tax=Brevundimonas sp. TaxID=1871086 RepID=UPI00289E8CA2|nr:nitronate monooxygenase [Brevundimonas sp.]